MPIELTNTKPDGAESDAPPALDPARAEAIRAEIAWRLDGGMTQNEAGYYGRGLTRAQS